MQPVAAGRGLLDQRERRWGGPLDGWFGSQGPHVGGESTKEKDTSCGQSLGLGRNTWLQAGSAWARRGPPSRRKPPLCARRSTPARPLHPENSGRLLGSLARPRVPGVCVCVCLLDGQVCVLAGQVGQLMKSSLGVLLSLRPVPQLPLSLVGLGPLSAQAAWARASCFVTLVTNLRVPRSTGDAILAEQ